MTKVQMILEAVESLQNKWDSPDKEIQAAVLTKHNVLVRISHINQSRFRILKKGVRLGRNKPRPEKKLIEENQNSASDENYLFVVKAAIQALELLASKLDGSKSFPRKQSTIVDDTATFQIELPYPSEGENFQCSPPEVVIVEVDTLNSTLTVNF